MTKNRVEQRMLRDFHPENFNNLSNDDANAIINPEHYHLVPAGNYPNGIQYMGLMAFLLEKKTKLDKYESHIYGQIIKYALRLGEKDAIRQDLKKVGWYRELLERYQDVKDGQLPMQTFVEQWDIVEKKVTGVDPKKKEEKKNNKKEQPTTSFAAMFDAEYEEYPSMKELGSSLTKSEWLNSINALDKLLNQ